MGPLKVIITITGMAGLFMTMHSLLPLLKNGRFYRKTKATPFIFTGGCFLLLITWLLLKIFYL